MRVYIVKVTDYDERPAPSHIDSVWIDIDNAVFRMNTLNNNAGDICCDFLAEVKIMDVLDT